MVVNFFIGLCIASIVVVGEVVVDDVTIRVWTIFGFHACSVLMMHER